ncbi:hypothetical protein NP233_g2068 [Leucocoprinus birnbaumii]|uniref:Homeobox domain-containing protein n=1 Tax=Leucocoprinus birnbaumii TaxID=56174 RepID=A0AAD5YXH8_9AGAR|nr:hypothetical protein NP233_g2068 [Leucocoprinus birnbaumii]
MNVQTSQKPKPVAIRATPTQTALLKAAYAVSYNPSPKSIKELSQQTGLYALFPSCRARANNNTIRLWTRPEKWISNWFSRQRTKARKNGEVIDLTTSSSTSTATSGTLSVTPTLLVAKVEEGLGGGIDTLSEDRSSSPVTQTSDAAPAQGKAKATKVPLKRAPRKSKPKPKPKPVVKPEPREASLPVAVTPGTVAQGRPPQLLPSVAAFQTGETVMQPPLPIPPPTRSAMGSRPPTKRIYSQNATNQIISQEPAEVFSTTGHFSVPLHDNPRSSTIKRKGRPIFRDDFRNSVPSDYYSDPVLPGDAASPFQRDMDFDSQRASSPVQPSEYSASDFAPAQLTASSTSAFLPSPRVPSAAQATDQQSLLNIQSQLAGYTAMYNNNPAAYRAMLLNYAALFPALLPAITALVASGSRGNVQATMPLASAGYTGVMDPDDFEVPPPSSSPILPSIAADDDSVEVPVGSSNYASMMKQDTQETPWSSGSDYLDFSSLNYDYAPFSHLQDRLEPYRLPESAYLFGREGIVNHLLDEQLAVEEPFQAAMGLVLLSKLGLQW